ncbi:hydrogenase-4 component G [Helicobacter sp.]|uniref:hydrogenase-4 component G n=1 Tax=Helicobacter sp. TaxID=218 RepID=UPI0025BE727A|nr:hydrogenase-4 component G [Helicobacter sp.]MCI5632082.1 hydrogenase-4 component G [Helicobacter sp.]
MAINVSVSSTKSSFEYANDLQSAMSSNPLKKSETSAEDRNKNIQEVASKVDAKSLMTGYVVQFQMNITISSETNFSSQNGLFGLNTSAMDNPFKLNDILNGLDLKSIGYEGKPIQELSQDEAKALIAEDGFFGVAKTSDRIADFVLAGAGDDVEKLKAGREGILRGYNQAEKAWGGNLPDISKETLEKALEKVDKKLASLGVNVLEQNA